MSNREGNIPPIVSTSREGEGNFERDLKSMDESILKKFQDDIRSILEEKTLGSTKDIGSEKDVGVEKALTIYKQLVRSYQNTGDIPIEKFLCEKGVYEVIHKYVEKNLWNILDQANLESFQLSSFLLYIIGGDKGRNVLKDLNTYDFQMLTEIFDDLISGITDDKQKREIYMYRFLDLCALVNVLSVSNQHDRERKKLIVEAVTIVEKSIHKLQRVLAEQKIQEKKDSQEETDQYIKHPLFSSNNILDYELARNKMTFTHVEYVDIKDLNQEQIIEKFTQKIDILVSSWNNAEKSNFGDKIERKEGAQKAFLGNVAYLYLMMLKKIRKKSGGIETIGNDMIIEHWNTFSNAIHMTTAVRSIEDIEKLCYSIFEYIYYEEDIANADFQVLFDKIHSEPREDIVENYLNYLSQTSLTGEKKEMKKNDSIESVYNMMLFRYGYSVDILCQLGTILVNPNVKNPNDNFEFFKLKILQKILSRLSEKHQEGDLNTKIQLVKDIGKYVDINKHASQLLSVYSKLYLGMAYFYSFIPGNETQTQAKKYLYAYISLNGLQPENISYQEDLKVFYENIGKHSIFDLLGKIDEKPNVLNEQFILQGEKNFKQSQRLYELESQAQLDAEMQKLLNQPFLSNTSISFEEVNKKLCTLIAEKMFYGLVEVSLVSDASEDTQKIGMSKNTIPIYNGYALEIYTPVLYAKRVDIINKTQAGNLQRIVGGLLKTYLLHKDSYVDSLTGLGNESFLQYKLGEHLENMGEEKVSLCFIKFPSLKYLNAVYPRGVGNRENEGESKPLPTGDYYIKVIAELLGKYFNDNNISLFRLGGKFAILFLGDYSQQQQNKLESMILQNMKKISQDIEDKKMGHNTQQYAVGMVSGVSPRKEIIRDASLALDSAIQEKKEFIIYNNELLNSYQDEQARLSELIDALNNQGIVPVYQPICNKQGDILKHETLMRLQLSHSSELQNPGKYLEIAKKYGYNITILEKMIDGVATKLSQGGNYKYTINIGSGDLSEYTVSLFHTKLCKSHNQAANITIEILESDWENIDNIMPHLKRLKQLGFKIAMDDFGSSTANLNNLIELLRKDIVDTVKIDGSLIRYMDVDTRLGDMREFQIKLITLSTLYQYITMYSGGDSQVYEQMIFEYLQRNSTVLNSFADLKFVDNMNIDNILQLKERIEVEISKCFTDKKYNYKESYEALFGAGKREILKDLNVLGITQTLNIFIEKSQVIFEKDAELYKNTLKGLIRTIRTYNPNIEIIAEFVASEELFKICATDLECNGMQGFYIGKPEQEPIQKANFLI